MNKKKDIGHIGALLTAGLAAVAGAYFLYGTKDGAKQRKKIRGWALKAKGEVLEKMEKLKDVDEETYKKIVDTVISKYVKVKADHEDEITKVSKELLGYWKHLKKHLSQEKPKKKTSKVKK